VDTGHIQITLTTTVEYSIVDSGLTITSSEVCDKLRLPVVAVKHKSSWFSDGVVEQQAMMICPISGQFSELAACTHRFSVVQFLTSYVDCQAGELSCSKFIIIIIIILVLLFTARQHSLLC